MGDKARPYSSGSHKGRKLIDCYSSLRRKRSKKTTSILKSSPAKSESDGPVANADSSDQSPVVTVPVNKPFESRANVSTLPLIELPKSRNIDCVFELKADVEEVPKSPTKSTNTDSSPPSSLTDCFCESKGSNITKCNCSNQRTCFPENSRQNLIKNQSLPDTLKSVYDSYYNLDYELMKNKELPTLNSVDNTPPEFKAYSFEPQEMVSSPSYTIVGHPRPTKCYKSSIKETDSFIEKLLEPRTTGQVFSEPQHAQPVCTGRYVNGV